MGWRGMLALFVVGLITSGLAGAAAYFLPVVVAAYAQTGQPRASTPAPEHASPGAPPAPAGGSAFTVLLMGSDDDTKFAQGVYLTQSMILIRINPATRHVTMLSIPRDLYVPWSTGGHGKIDEVHQYGDAASVATVERNFNIHVDEWAWVGLKGLVKLIDLMGGVDLTTGNPVLDDFYPADLESTNPYSYKRVAVLPGPQHLDGIHALEYVRSRHGDIQEDFGRSQRQQQVLLALRTKAKNVNAADLPGIVASFHDEFKTSFNLSDFGRLRSLISLASQISDPSQIEQIVLVPPYTGSDVINGADVVTPNWSLIRPLIQQKFT
ncbi:MAG TPA: LCP family protein [Candidatus Dormibacteraeota bacterium]|nr:LCP family protein [Candidatus Dormibacteraeota bacterium]